jgi:hypothetical protein
VTRTWRWLQSFVGGGFGRDLGGARQRRARQAARQKPVRFVPSMLVLERRDAPAITVKGGFEGIRFNDPGAGFAPPNSDVAVGPSSLIATVSNAAQIRAKDGTVLSNVDLSTFFQPVTTGSFFFQPNVVYDDNSQRFFIAMLEEDPGLITSFLHVAVSNTSTPTDFAADFTEKATVDVVEIDATGRLFTADFPRIGYNADGLFVTFNSLDIATGGVDHAAMITFRKSTLLDADNTTLRLFPTIFTTQEYTVVPAQMHQAPAGAPMILIDTIGFGPAPLGTSNAIQVLEMTNYFSAVPTIARHRIAVQNFNNGFTPNATQPFLAVTQIPLITFDTSLLEAAWRDGHLVATGNANINGVTKARWYEISAPANGARPTLIQQGNIDPGPGISTFMPAIDIAQNLDIGMTYLQSSASEFMSMYITGRKQSDAKGTMQTPVRVRAGEAVYLDIPPFTGFFSAVAVDPLNPNTFVAANEYATAAPTLRNWGTWISTFTLAGPTPSPIKGLNPLRWIYNRATDIYSGTLIIANTTTAITGTLTLVLTLPDASVQVLTPGGTRVGNTYTIPIIGPFVKNQPIRITIQLLNPLRFPLGSIQMGLITSIS